MPLTSHQIVELKKKDEAPEAEALEKKDGKDEAEKNSS